jgi:hypothetical protein
MRPWTPHRALSISPYCASQLSFNAPRDPSSSPLSLQPKELSVPLIPCSNLGVTEGFEGVGDSGFVGC